MTNKKTLINFRKAQSLLSKIIEMSEEKAYCIDILHIIQYIMKQALRNRFAPL